MGLQSWRISASKNGKIRYIVSVVSWFTNFLGKFICFSKFRLKDCRQGARKLGTNAKEATQGVLLIHLIDDLLLKQGGGGYINSDPVSGQDWKSTKRRNQYQTSI